MSNLRRHFQNIHVLRDKNCADWFDAYKNSKKKIVKLKKISKHMLNFLTWFSDTNMPMSQVYNPLLWPILHPELKLDSFDCFRNRLIPSILNILKLKIGKDLNNSAFASIIPDGWTCPL